MVCFAACHSSGLSVGECGAAGSASARTACAICPTLRQSQSRHSHANPLHPGARLRPSYQSGCVYFLFPWCQSPLLFDSLSVLVVRGGAVCLPTPPSWFSPIMKVFSFNFLSYSFQFLNIFIIISLKSLLNPTSGPF